MNFLFTVQNSDLSFTPSALLEGLVDSNRELMLIEFGKAFRGIQGIQGIQGIHGVQGAVGQTVEVYGLQGTQGIQGNLGISVQGVQGTQGISIQGQTGIQGFTGLIGSQGIQGSQGVQGSIGAQGQIGSQGIQGNIGNQGNVGSQGIQGIEGNTGAQGIQGILGAQGFIGLQGIQGISGTQGQVGSQGSTGNTGIQGLQGLIGVQGFTGIQGLQGIQGFIGEAGDSSYDYYSEYTSPNERLSEQDFASLFAKLPNIDSKTNLLSTDGAVNKYLAEDGVYREIPIQNISYLSEDESTSGMINILGYDYSIYTKTIEVEISGALLDELFSIKLSDTPIGFNRYLKVDILNISYASNTIGAGYLQNEIQLLDTQINDDLTTQTTLKALTNIINPFRVTLQASYVKDFGETLEFSIQLPLSISPEDVNLVIPELKYNKKVVASITVDDSCSMWNNLFSAINKKWIDNEKMSFFNPSDSRDFFGHMNMTYTYNSITYTKSDGYVPLKPLEYTDSAGVKHRFAASNAAWADKFGPVNSTPSIFWPWCGADESVVMQDFGFSFNFHDIFGITAWQLANGTTYVPPKEFLQMVKTDSTSFNNSIKRRPKIMQGPNGDPNYIYMSRECPLLQYNMEISNRNTDSICTTFKPFNNSYILDLKSNKYLVQRKFLLGNYTFQAWKDDVLLQNTLPLADREWVILGMHKIGRDADTYGLISAINDIEEALGASGTDTIWFPSIDEVYEYIFMRQHSKVYKSINGNTVTFKLHVPCNANFWFRSLSCLISGISTLDDIVLTSSSNCVGFSYGINDNKLLVNLNFNTDLITKVEKYLDIYLIKQDIPSYEDAAYFIQQLKPSLQEPYLAILNPITSAPTITSMLINSGDASTLTRLVTVTTNIEGTASEMIISENQDFSGASWEAFVSSKQFTLSENAEVKTLYIKTRNVVGESNVISQNIEYIIVTLELTSIVINSNESTTTDRNISIVPNYVGEVTHYKVSEDSELVGADWIVITNPILFQVSESLGLKTIYVQLKNTVVESSIVSSTITLESAELPDIIAAMSLKGGISNNTILYDSTFGYTVNVIHLADHISYTPKQLQSKTGELLPWYFELNTNLYPINSQTIAAGPRLAEVGSFNPILTGDAGPYADTFISKSRTVSNDGANSYKGRLVFSLPEGSYKMKIIASVEAAGSISAAQLPNLLYRVDINNVIGTPVPVGPTGFTGVRNVDFNAEIPFTVNGSEGLNGGTVLYIYHVNPSAIYNRPYLNLVEITKLN